MVLLVACLALIQLYSQFYSTLPPGLGGGALPAVILFPAQFVVALVY